MRRLHLLGRRHGVKENACELLARRPGSPGKIERVLHLTEDLILAENKAFKPRRHLKKISDRLAALPVEQGIRQLRLLLQKNAAHRLVGLYIPPRVDIIKLAAVAGGENRGLRYSRSPERFQRLKLLRVAEGRFVPQTQRRLLIADAPNGKLHVDSPFFHREAPG